jgi:uncharacterized protein (DUF58 family)
MTYLARRFDLYIQPRTWWLLSLLWALFVLAYPFPVLLAVAKTGLLLLCIAAAIDLLLLFIPSNPLLVERECSPKWSLGDDNTVKVMLHNNVSLPWNCMILDELPIELQERKFSLSVSLAPLKKDEICYTVKPLKRGIYAYGQIRVIISSPMLGVFGRRISAEQPHVVSVYPSFVQLRKYSLYTLQNIARFHGFKKIRRIGMSYEFEQIKEYVQGDDIRHINWKATGKTKSLKTNHFTEEKAQPVYVVIDKSRPMNMAFGGMTLLDYAVNAGAVVANIALQKGDKAGLLTFSDRVGAALRADSSPGQMGRIMDALHAEKYRRTEADFEFVYNAMKRVSSGRSLMFLFTNFETLIAMQRVLPVLRKLNRQHLLVVIFFSNDEVENYAYEPAESLQEIYNRMVARQMVGDKRQMAVELANHGIQSVVCKPEELTINTLNKYLELKAKGMIG